MAPKSTTKSTTTKATPSTSTPAVLYLRLSKDHAGAADSLEGQEARLRERAAAEGLAVAEVYSEGAGRSAYSGKARPAWEALLSELRPGMVVLAVEMSRTARRAALGLADLARIVEAGAALVTLDGYDSRRDPSNLSPGIRLLVAEEESRLKSERIRRRKAHQRAAGYWTGPAPFGYVRTPSGRLVLDPEEAATIRRAVSLIVEEGLGIVAAARALNTEGRPSPRGAAWSQPTLAAILRSPVLYGAVVHGKRWEALIGPDGAPVLCVDGPAVLTVAEYHRLRAVLSSRGPVAPNGPTRGGRPSRALLARLVYCGRCGALMTSTGPQYGCSAAKMGKPCEGLTVMASVVEPEALRRVTAYLAALDPESPEGLEVLAAAAEALQGRTGSEEASAVAAEMDAARARLEALEADYYGGTITMAADRFATLHATLTARLEALSARLESLGGGAPDLGPVLDLVASREALETATPDTLRALIRAAVVRIDLAPAPARGCRFTPDRLRITWRA